MLIGLSVVSFIPSLKAVSEAPPIQWQQFFNGSSGYSVLQTLDGGYVVTGANASTSLLISIDLFGKLLWVKTYQIEGKYTGLPYLGPTNDGGYALAGTWENQFALVKVDSEGKPQWNKTYEYSAPFNYLRSFIQTSEVGCAIVGTYLNNPQGDGQIWFVKTDTLGNMQLNKTIIGSLGTFADSVFQTSDGEYTKIAKSSTPGFPSFFQLIKTDSDGNVQWNKTYGGIGSFDVPQCNSGIITRDGGYLLAGFLAEGNAWLVKTDSQGKICGMRLVEKKTTRLLLFCKLKTEVMLSREF